MVLNRRPVAWTPEQSVEALRCCLDAPANRTYLEIFEAVRDAGDLEVFNRDASRRQEGQPSPVLEWWGAVRQVTAANLGRYLALVEPLAQRGVTLEALFRHIPSVYHPEALKNALARCGRPELVSGFLPGITNTAGWSDKQIRVKLEEVKITLDWPNTVGSAHKWWEAFEAENKTKINLVLRLAEELANREATITKFFNAYLYSNTDNIQANLSFLDFTVLKEKVREEKKAAAGRAGDSPTEDLRFDGFEARTLGYKPGITDTRVWSDAQITANLEGVKATLDWPNTTGSAREWWAELEAANRHRSHLILELAEELGNRKATITEFFLAHVYSEIDNLLVTLHYLDYSRLKAAEERKKRDAAAAAATAALERYLAGGDAGRGRAGEEGRGGTA